jgi:hypothetical protein
METIVDVVAKLAEKGNTKVENIVLEGAVLNEEVDVQDLKLRPCKNVSENLILI